MRITLDSLRVLDAIDRKNSFSAAAEELCRVPSAVTYAIKQLESDLGILIFDRSGHRATLTPAGHELLKGGRALLEKAHSLEKNIRISAGLALPNLSISFDEALNLDGINNVLLNFFKDFPDVCISLSAEILNGCADALVHGEADLSIGYFGELPTHANFQYEPLGEIPFVFAHSPDHPLSNLKDPLRQQDIAKHRIVVVPDTAKTIQKASSGYMPDLQFLSVSSMDAKLKAQAAGLGVGFVPLSWAKPYLASGMLVERQVDRPKGNGHCYMAWKVERMSPPLAHMIELIRTHKDRILAYS